MVENQFNFNFEFTTSQEPGLKAWEDENIEYASWNLILDKKDTAFC